MNKYSSPTRLTINKHMAESDFPSAQEYVSSDSILTKEEKAKALALASGVKEEDLPFSIKHPGIYKALSAVGSGLAGYGVMKGLGHAIPSTWNGDAELNMAKKILADTDKHMASSDPSENVLGLAEAMIVAPSAMTLLPAGLAKKIVAGTAIGGAGLLAALGIYAATRVYAKKKRKQIAENYDDMSNKSERQLNFGKLAANIDNISKRKANANTNLPTSGQTLVWKGSKNNTKQAGWATAFSQLLDRGGFASNVARWGVPTAVGTAAGITENNILKEKFKDMPAGQRIAYSIAGGAGSGMIASPVGIRQMYRVATGPITDVAGRVTGMGTPSAFLTELTKQIATKAVPTAVVAGASAVGNISGAAQSINTAAQSAAEAMESANRSMTPKISITKDNGKQVSITPLSIYKAMEHQQFPKTEIEKKFNALGIDVPSSKEINTSLPKERKNFIKDLSNNVSNWKSMTLRGNPIDQITGGAIGGAIGGVSDSASKAFKVISDTGDWFKENKTPVLIGAGVIGGGLLLKTVYDSVQQHYKDERKRKLEELALSRAGIS